MSGDPIVLNTAPPISTFASQSTALTRTPVIRFPGGAVLEAQVDPRGGAGTCALNLDLVGKLQGAIAPFMPLFNLLDVVTTLIQCFLLMKDAITNPFKIPDLVKCLPGLIAKLNTILALIPVFPQGIAAMITFVVDTLSWVDGMLACTIQQLQALQAELVEIGRLTDTLTRTEDTVVAQNLKAMIDAATADVSARATTILAAIGPVARLLCTVRSLLAIVPGGLQIAQQMTIPDPSQITNLSSAIGALTGVRQVITSVVGLLNTLGNPFGAPLAQPAIGFSCPLDVPQPASTPAPATAPTISSVTLGGLLVPPATLPVAAPNGADVQVTITGTGFGASSQVYWNSTQVQTVQLSSPTTLLATLPAALRTNTGKFYLMVVNVPVQGGAGTFQGLSPQAGVPASTGVQTSSQYQVGVA